MRIEEAWPGVRASGSSSLAISSMPCAGASWTIWSPNSQWRPGSHTNPSAEGEHVAHTYRQRVALASGRFVMSDIHLPAKKYRQPTTTHPPAEQRSQPRGRPPPDHEQGSLGDREILLPPLPRRLPHAIATGSFSCLMVVSRDVGREKEVDCSWAT